VVFNALTESHLAGAELGEVVAFHATLKGAELARRDAISDEPTWVNDLGVIENRARKLLVELGALSETIGSFRARLSAKLAAIAVTPLPAAAGTAHCPKSTKALLQPHATTLPSDLRARLRPS
jgi:hypothetical protein